MTGFDSMHGWPSTDVSFFPVAILQAVSTRILKPGHMASQWVTLKHEWAVVVTNDKIHETILGNVHGHHSDWRIKFANLVLWPV